MSLSVDDDPTLPKPYVYVAWHDCTSGNPDIWFSRSKNLGNAGNWSTPIKVNLDGGTAQQVLPAMTTKNGEVYLAFYDTRRNASKADIFFAESIDHGLSFGSNLQVTDVNFPWVSQQGHYMGIAANATAVFPIWTDGRNSATQGNDIYVDRLTGGAGGSVAYGTLITLADGSQVPVQRVVVGDRVVVYDVYAGSGSVETVQRIATTTVDNLLTIHTTAGMPLRIDYNPYLRLKVMGYDGSIIPKSATEIAVGDRLFNYYVGGWVTVTGTTAAFGGQHLMFDLYTDTNADYIANGYPDCPCKEGPGP
jgi:hypothetical protein